MPLDYLTMDIEYRMRDNHYTIKGDVNKKGQHEIIAEFLRMQIGAGRDSHEPDKRDIYHIALKFYPGDDSFEVSSDTGNKGLRDGILLGILKRLDP